MKRSFALLLITFSAATAHAGSFGGPPPFQNGSPLVTGVDGSYQASARSTNVTGIFRFKYADGTQTASASDNSWIFFVNGQVQRGTVVANINGSQLDGVLDSLSAGSSTNSNGTITLPIVFLNANNSSSGNFHGTLKLNSPTGAFSGKGRLMPSPATTNQVIAISTNAFGTITVTNANYTNVAGSIPPTNFKFTGVRTTVLTSSSSSTN